MDLIAFLSAAIIAKGVYALRWCACAWQKSLCCCRAVSPAITHARTITRGNTTPDSLNTSWLCFIASKSCEIVGGWTRWAATAGNKLTLSKSLYSNISTGKISFVFQIIITVRFRFKTMTWAPIRVPRTRILKRFVVCTCSGGRKLNQFSSNSVQALFSAKTWISLFG